MWRITSTQAALLLTQPGTGQTINLASGQTIKYVVATSGGTILSISATGNVSTGLNTLDNGSGNMIASGTLSGANGKFAVNGVGTIAVYGSVATPGKGTPPIYGTIDQRTGVITPDGAATVLYTTTNAGQLYSVMARCFLTAGASASYTIGWTEASSPRTAVITATTDGGSSSKAVVIQPDNGSQITAQITALSASTVDVAAYVTEAV
jgi:hypothetical protein